MNFPKKNRKLTVLLITIEMGECLGSFAYLPTDRQTINYFTFINIIIICF